MQTWYGNILFAGLFKLIHWGFDNRVGLVFHLPCPQPRRGRAGFPAEVAPTASQYPSL